MKHFLLCLLVVRSVFAVNQAPSLTGFTPEEVAAFLKKNPDVNQVETFLRRLPESFFSHYVLLTSSESLQPAAPWRPRVILSSEQSDVVIGFATEKDNGGSYADHSIEMISFNAPKAKFDFHRITFEKGEAEYQANPVMCKSCHGQNPRPNWDTYQIWPNALPFNSDRIFQGSEEEKLFKHVFTSLQKDPRFGLLKPHEGVIVSDDGTELAFEWEEKSGAFLTPQGHTVEQGGPALILEHPKAAGANGDGQATALFDQISKLNATKIAQELVENPSIDRFKYAVVGVLSNCLKKPEDFRAFFPPAVFTASKKFHELSLSELIKDTADRRDGLNLVKLEQLEKNMLRLVLVNARHSGEELTEDEIQKRIYGEIYRRNPATLNKFPIHKKSGLNSAESQIDFTLAALRFFLEPQEVAVGKWSLSARERSTTYTFSDVFDTYRATIIPKIKPLLGTTVDCKTLGQKSYEAYLRAL